MIFIYFLVYYLTFLYLNQIIFRHFCTLTKSFSDIFTLFYNLVIIFRHFNVKSEQGQTGFTLKCRKIIFEDGKGGSGGFPPMT